MTPENPGATTHEMQTPPLPMNAPDGYLPDLQPAQRPWVSPRMMRRIAGAFLATQALNGSLAACGEPLISGTPQDTVDTNFPTQTSSDTEQSTATTTQTVEVPVTTTAPGTTVYVPAPKTPGTSPAPTVSSEADSGNGSDNGGSTGGLSVMPNLVGAQPGFCGIGGTSDTPQLLGYVSPDCGAAAPVRVRVGFPVYPICQKTGGVYPLGDGEEHQVWVEWQNQHGNRYFSPSTYVIAAVGLIGDC